MWSSDETPLPWDDPRFSSAAFLFGVPAVTGKTCSSSLKSLSLGSSRPVHTVIMSAGYPTGMGFIPVAFARLQNIAN